MVDPALRGCEFVRLYWRAIPELTAFASERLGPTYGLRIRASLGAPVMLYRYGLGVGFLPHHDEVTAEELRRAETNGQPVMGGDLTIVVFLNSLDEYTGGELFFPELGLSFKPDVGAGVVFPATRSFVHGVAPITQGARFTCVARCYVDVGGGSA
jgi:PKHD-type hydroxylase